MMHGVSDRGKERDEAGFPALAFDHEAIAERQNIRRKTQGFADPQACPVSQ